MNGALATSLVAMDDAGFIFGAYGATIGAVGLYAWYVIRRARRAAARIADDDKPWL